MNADLDLGLRVEHLPGDVFGLSDVARAGLAAGPSFGPVPVVTRPQDVSEPEERLGAEERGILVDLLQRGYHEAGLAVAAGGPLAKSFASLRQEGTSCVVTGQQAGFLASPLYSLYKALQACRAAEELSAQWGKPVVPVFWNHADDHDVAEVHHAWQLNRNLDLQKVHLGGLSSGRTPLGELSVTEEAQRLGALRALLHDIVEEHEHADLALDLFLPRDGETLPRALSRAFHALTERFGLILCEPEWIRSLLSSEMGRIVSMASPSMVEALRSGGRELEGLGLTPAIPVGEVGDAGEDAAALVFRHVRPAERALPERIALRAGGEGLRMDGEPGSRTHAEVGSLIVSAADEWSAGALVRPVVQDAVFPTCAYVGGYGELGYHAQLGALREASGQPRTPFIPRVSISLVDGDTRYALERIDATIETILRERGAFQPPEIDLDAEPEVVQNLRASSEAIAEQLLGHKAGLAALEPALGITLKKTAGHVQHSIGKVIDKAMRVHKNSTGKGVRQVRRANSMLYPREAPQERVLGPFQFVARFGSAFVPSIHAEIPFASTEHIVLHLPSSRDA
ncbi:MAG: bacillithiol biosynthesis BshC [Planctomycetota bacterium]